MLWLRICIGLVLHLRIISIRLESKNMVELVVILLYAERVGKKIEELTAEEILQFKI